MTKVLGLERRRKARGILQSLALQVQRLHQEAAAKNAEIKALQKRLARVEAEQKIHASI